jgi:DNA-binding MarR family transcriptional regulator
MGEVLRRRLHQTRFDDRNHEAMLALLVAAADVRGDLERVCATHGLTGGQFNVLRILRGNPEGYPRCEILARLIDRAPDVTRLIDRLERQGLVERARGERDRRQSITRITRRGLDLLDRMQPAVDRVHRAIGTRLPARATRELARLCEALISTGEAPS